LHPSEVFLVRSDSGQEVLQKETVNVSQLVEIVAEEMRQIAYPSHCFPLVISLWDTL